MPVNLYCTQRVRGFQEDNVKYSQNSVEIQFGNKIRFAVSVLRFVDICSDTRSGSADLIGNDRFVLAFQEFHQIEYLHGKVNGKCTQSAFSHKIISFRSLI